MFDFPRLEAAMRRRVPVDRLRHVYGVVETALDLARKYGGDPDRVRAAALMHDYAKALPPEELLSLGRRFGLITDPAEEENPELLHAPVGAALLEEEGLITDPEVLSAIRWHTTGTPGMSHLDQIIWLADLIEPTRRFPGVEEIRAAAWKDLSLGVLAGLDHTLTYLIRTGRRIHLKTVETRNWLLGQLQEVGRAARAPA
ncbi:MAG: bis(5'-nucleosyl)-tetraphosphatase (symmetrical) YqeK [Firmicutes bacterium]|nr:bis(5'-nucleosyl)-tetraphosphatase (symmetrical) YqeK [Bacillota bacterium]